MVWGTYGSLLSRNKQAYLWRQFEITFDDGKTLKSSNIMSWVWGGRTHKEFLETLVEDALTHCWSRQSTIFRDFLTQSIEDAIKRPKVESQISMILPTISYSDWGRDAARLFYVWAPYSEYFSGTGSAAHPRPVLSQETGMLALASGDHYVIRIAD